MGKDYFLLLVTKKLTGNITGEEEAFLQETLETDELYRIEYEYIIDFWHREKIVPAGIQQQLAKVWSAIEKEASCEMVNSKLAPRSIKIVTLSKILKIAALIILFATGTSYLFTLVHKKRHLPPAEILATIKKQTSDTGISFLLLPDGTKVWLNRSSRLDYNENFGSEKREATLSGEAFFDVVKNDKLPFIIHAQNIDIKVKGTAFNVSAYSKNHFVETALLRGLVEVVDNNKPGKTIFLKPNEKLIIPRQPGAGIKNNVIESLSREPSTLLLPETAWLENKLIFNKAPFESIAEKMERWYGVEIHVESNDLRLQKFSGAFDKETLIMALSALELSYPFHYSIENKTVTITK